MRRYGHNEKNDIFFVIQLLATRDNSHTKMTEKFIQDGFFFKETQKIEFLITNTALFVIVTWYSSSPSTNFKFWKGFNVLYSSFLYVHKRCRFPHCDGIKSLVDYLLESMFLFWSVINLSTKFQRAFERRGKNPTNSPAIIVTEEQTKHRTWRAHEGPQSIPCHRRWRFTIYSF